MSFRSKVRNLCYVFVAVLVASCATPATRSELTPAYTAQVPSKVTIGVIDNRPYVVSGEKEPWFEGLTRDGFGIPHTFNRPKRPATETFADRIASMLERTFVDAGSQVKIVKLPKGLPRKAAIERLEPGSAGATLLVQIFDSKFDAGGFSFNYEYDFRLNVLGPEGNILAEATNEGQGGVTPSDKHSIWDMFGVVYREKFDRLLANPDIQQAIARTS